MAKKTDPESGETTTTTTVTVQATTTLFEGGVVYKAGDPFETSAERAAALGDSVKPAEAV